MSHDIHPTAIISQDVKIGKDVKILPYCVIEGDVEIGDGCVIGPYAHISNWVKIGTNTKIYMSASIGEEPQDYAFDGTVGLVEIGSGCKIREFVTIHMPVIKDGVEDKTVLDDGVFMMACSHLAHNGKIGKNSVLANSALIAGYGEVEEEVFISANVGLHQFTQIGAYSMIGFGAKIAQNVPPFMLVDGIPATVRGLNVIGLRRKGFNAEQRKNIKDAFKMLYCGESYSNACLQIEEKYPQDENVVRLVQFVRESSKRGIVGSYERKG